MLARVRAYARLLEMAVRSFYHNRGPASAASLAFYGLFSGFPLLLLSVITSAAVLDPRQAADRVQAVIAEYVPIYSGFVEDNIQSAVGAGGAAAGLSALALLWSGTRVFDSVTSAINDAWEVRHNYSIRVRVLIQPLLVALAVLLIASGLAYPVLGGRVWSSWTGSPGLPDTALSEIAGDIWGKVAGFLVVLLLYRFLPRTQVRWRDALPGAVVATVLFQLSEEVFEFYVSEFRERYTQVYGNLSDVAVLLLWAYITAAIFLMGAHFCAAYRNRDEGRAVRAEDAPVAEKLEEASR